MKPLKYLLFVILTCLTLAQTTYELQTGSTNNLFKLSISNNTSNLMQPVKVFVQATGMVNDHVVSCYRYKEMKTIHICPK